jgi:hypothetical protein
MIRHIILSLPDETVTMRRQLKKIARGLAPHLSDGPWIATAHRDQGRVHVHVIIQN